MSVMIQIRNVPEPLHRKLKVRAAEAGMSLSAYLERELERIAAKPTREEVIARIASRSRVSLPESAASVLRAERGGR